MFFAASCCVGGLFWQFTCEQSLFSDDLAIRLKSFQEKKSPILSIASVWRYLFSSAVRTRATVSAGVFDTCSTSAASSTPVSGSTSMLSFLASSR
jgi:hypothetical protein